MFLFTILLISAIVTIVSMPCCQRIACKLQAVDAPNDRKIHSSTMPKCGGMAMALGAMCSILLWVPMTSFSRAALMGAFIIMLFGIFDDIRDLGPKTKLGGQICAAMIAVFFGGVKIKSLGGVILAGMVLPEWFAIVLTLFVVVGVTNATNLSDGLDGLAGGLSLLVFIFISYLGYIEKNFVVTAFAVAMVGAILGFLRFNTYPAVLFMGDAGSQLLGFISIVLLLKISQQSAQCSTVLPLIVMGVPVMDTLTVMAKRMAKGRSPFVADKNHFHHQLIDMGLYHSEAVLCIYIVQAVLIVLAIIFRQANEWILLAAYFVFSVILTGLLIISAKTNFKFNRRVYLDPIKKRLRTAKDRGSFIKLAFGLVKAMVPVLLLFNCIVYAPIPNTYVFFSVGNFILIMIVWWLKKEFIGNVVRMSLYIITPFLVYMSDIGVAGHFDSTMVRLYNFSYLILFLSVLLTVYLTRRSTRFQSSTMDFLAVFMILLVSKLPFTGGQDYRMGLVAAKTIVLFFSYEVLLGELRLRSYKLPITATMMVLLLANARTIFG